MGTSYMLHNTFQTAADCVPIDMAITVNRICNTLAFAQ